MRKAIQILNEFVENGIVENYAIGGAIGLMFYTETLYTKDLDIFIAPQVTESGIAHFSEIYDNLKKQGYCMQGQYFIIEDIPVDFVAVYNELTKEALENFAIKKYEGIETRVLMPEYLLAIALQTGRKQDYRKIDLLIGSVKLDKKMLKDILTRHNLYNKWLKYVGKK